jgi:2-methylcitrate dehydratase PrpD
MLTMDATQRLAVFTHALEFAALPPSTVGACSRLVLDTVASAIPAWDLPGVAELRTLMSEWSTGGSRVWISGERLSPPAATLVNAAMSHALEYDDLHSELPVHVGTVVVPVALAVAQTRPQVTGAELTVAIIAGAEVMCRLARATRSYRGKSGFRGWNPTSVVAGFGAAVTAGKLLGLDAAGISRAMGLSYAQAGGNQQCIVDSGLMKRMQPGMVAEAGVRAAWLAQVGITGAVDALEGRYGFFNLYERGDYDADVLTGALGEGFEIERLGLKRYPICGMSHPAVDCLRDIIRSNHLTRDNIAAVTAEGSRFVIDQVGRRYEPGENPEVTAQFNLAYCLATVLETGTFRLADLEPGHTLDPARRAQADRIVVTLDEALQGKWTCRIRVRLQNGEEISGIRSRAASQEERPLSDLELQEKFLEAAALSKAPFAVGGPERLASLLGDLPHLATLDPLYEALVPTPRA